jgi:hypothetical protein
MMLSDQSKHCSVFVYQFTVFSIAAAQSKMSTIMRSELETSPFLKETRVEEASEQQQRHSSQDRWQNASTRTKSLLILAFLLAYTLLVVFTADIMRISPAHVDNGNCTALVMKTRID